MFLKKGEELIHQIPENSPTALEFYGTQASLYNWIGEFQKSLDILTNKSLIQTQLPYDKYHILMARNYEGLGNYQKAFHCMQEACIIKIPFSMGKLKMSCQS